MVRTLTSIALTILALPVMGDQTNVRVLDKADLKAWETKAFEGATNYTAARVDSLAAIKAQSHGTASGMVRKITVNLAQTPYLNWRWRIENVLTNNDERTKAGDDYPARIYVVVSGGLFFWKTRAINYVWSSHQPPEAIWPNAYTANAQMVAVRSGPAQIGRWVDEKRNVREDLRRWFAEDVEEIHAVAFMTDTDNTGQSATAYYGNIYFSAR